MRRGWLGVNIQQVTDEIAESLGLHGGGRGALVARAQEDGPAAKGGIRNGDVVLRFNGQEVREMRNLPRIVADTPVGRAGAGGGVARRQGGDAAPSRSASCRPSRSRPPPRPARRPTGRPSSPASACGSRRISPETRERFSLRPEQRGVVITEVAPDSPAAERELRPGDVIVEVQQERVNTPQEVQERLEQLRQQNRATALLLIESRRASASCRCGCAASAAARTSRRPGRLTPGRAAAAGPG